jgi:hypothetical protein
VNPSGLAGERFARHCNEKQFEGIFQLFAVNEKKKLASNAENEIAKKQ